jgi:prolipoprotein diacylglyceryltransferase
MFPILYQNGPFILYTHDFFTMLGLLVGLSLYYYELHRRDMLDYRIFWISLAALLGGGIGARLSVVWQHPAYYADIGNVPVSYYFAHSGKSIIGGIAGGYLAIVLAKRAFRYTRSTGDCYAAAIPLAMAVGRVGCFLSELPLGTPTNLPWGVTVSEEAARHYQVCPYCNGKMHPSMVYEIIFHLAAFFLILRYRDRLLVQGDALKIYLLSAAVFRFLVEYVRGSEPVLLGLTGAQVALIPLTIPVAFYFVRQWHRGVYRMPAPPAPAEPAQDERLPAGAPVPQSPATRRVPLVNWRQAWPSNK